jgi:hypothetical protein
MLSAGDLQCRPYLDEETTAMLLASINHHDHAEIGERIHDAPAATSSLLREIIEATCRRFPSIGQSTKTARIERLLDADAFAEGVLGLIDLELPQWQIRRIAYDSGEWYCALSRERELPDWLDQSVEGRHRDLALAILAAYVEAQAVTAPESQPSVPASRPAANPLYVPMGCDDFA